MPNSSVLTHLYWVLLSAIAIGLSAAVPLEQADAQQKAKFFYGPDPNDERNYPAISALAVTPDQESILVGSDSGVQIISAAGDELSQLDTQLEQIGDIQFSPDGSLIAVAGGRPGIRGDIELWTAADKTRIAHLNGHADFVNQVAFSRDSNHHLLSASADHTLRVWDLQNHETIKVLQGHSDAVLTVAISPDGSLACSGSVDNTIRVWDTSTWNLRRTLNNHLDTVNRVAFDPTSKQTTLASAGEDATVRVWYPDIGRLVRIIRHPAPVLSVEFPPEGESLLTGSVDGVIRQIVGRGPPQELITEPVDNWLVSMKATEDRILVGTVDGRIYVIPPAGGK